MDINSAWKGACRVLLGEEIGELGEYAGYLKKYREPLRQEKSGLTGKPIYVAEQDFCRGARFIKLEETGEYLEKLGKAQIDFEKIASLDSLLSAVFPKAYYAGNIVLGNSGHCVDSDRCSNVFYALESHSISDSKYCAYSSLLRTCDNCFGTSMEGQGSMLINCSYGFKPIRCFECLRMMNCSDCYFSSSLENCQNCIFCFNLMNKNHCVGNVQLTKEEYASFKKKFLFELVATLKKEKRAIGIADILSFIRGGAIMGRPEIQRGVKSSPYFGESEVSQKIEEGFRKTTRLLLGKELAGIGKYERWLFRSVAVPGRIKSAASGKILHNMPVAAYSFLKESCVTYEEAEMLGKRSLGKEELGKLALHSAKQILGDIAYSTPETKLGESHDIGDAVNYSDSRSCWRGSVYWTSKYCCYNFWIRDGEYVFGSDLVFYSSFCLKCFNSNHLARCFEVSESLSCTDCYFCHNCENLADCMFCFNVKAKRYAIGTVEVGRESYMRIRKMVLGEIASELEREHDLKISIYNVGCKV